MGEYAKRKSDGARVKIGTCEDMYYLRYEQRHLVAHESGNVDPARDPNGLRFRLPFPDEDHIQPGDFEPYDRSQRLYRQCGVGASSYCEDFKDESTLEEPGIIQLRHECGLLVNVPCYHGIKLPEVVKPMQSFWNGKGWFFVLSSLRVADGVVYPVVRCQHCGGAWRYQWRDVWDYIPLDMQRALRVYAEAAGLRHDGGGWIEQPEVVSA